MANTGLSSFPPELVKEIVDYLPHTDLPAARFMNKQFKAIAAPLLFDTIPLWISQKSLGSLTDLSNHPELGFYVKQIVFSTLQLVEHKQEAEYLSKVKTALEYHTESLCSVALQFCKHRSAYRAYIETQRYLAEDKIAVKLLGHAFKRFPNLFAVTVNNYDQNTGAKELSSAFGSFHPDDLLSYEGHNTLPTLISGLTFANVKIKSFTFGSDLDLFMDDEEICPIYEQLAPSFSLSPCSMALYSGNRFACRTTFTSVTDH